ncbi:MAG TPA: hypothetical protein VM598_07715 [Bdellovibrionota bacterium]|nr:hypothetical protein [Bdellovibrionota bacterium]
MTSLALVGLLTVFVAPLEAVAATPRWFWPTEPGHPTVAEICAETPKEPDAFPSEEFIRAIERERDENLGAVDQLASGPGGAALTKRARGAKLYYEFFAKLELAKASYFSAVCTLRKTRRFDQGLALKAAALCDISRFIDLKAEYARLAAAMPERATPALRKKIRKWSEEGDAAASVIEEAEYSFLLDTGRLDDRAWPKGLQWPKFWSDEQRRVACAPFVGQEPEDLRRALVSLTGDPEAQVTMPAAEVGGPAAYPAAGGKAE